MAVCSQVQKEHINTLCGQNVELLCVKPGGIYSNHWVSTISEKRVCMCASNFCQLYL